MCSFMLSYLWFIDDQMKAVMLDHLCLHVRRKKSDWRSGCQHDGQHDRDSGHIRAVREGSAHVCWQQIRRGRAAIQHGVTEKRRQRNLLTAEGTAEKQREGWSTGAKQALPGTGSSKAHAFAGWGGEDIENLTQHRGNYLKGNTDGGGERKLKKGERGGKGF